MNRTILKHVILIFGSSEIWSAQLSVLYNRHTEVTEGTEVNAMSRRCRRHKRATEV